MVADRLGFWIGKNMGDRPSRSLIFFRHQMGRKYYAKTNREGHFALDGRH